MRKIIYKGELFEIYQKINDDAIISILENKLFQSYNNDRGDKKFYVKESLKTISEIEKSTKEIDGINSEIIEELLKIFDIIDDFVLPERLKEDILNDKVVLFIGAGVSKSLGYPTWVEFSKFAINKLQEEGYINHFEKEELKKIQDPKEILSLFDNICPRTGSCSNKFYTDKFEMKSLDITPYENDIKDNLYYLLTDKIFGWKFITTNIDKEIVKAKAYHKYKHLQSLVDIKNGESTTISFHQVFNSELQKTVSFDPSFTDIDNNIVFLHGIVDDVENTIFTTKDYLRTYFNQGSKEQIFLQNVFENYTVLFVGYGLSEFSILESIVNSSSRTHYSLYPVYYGDTGTLRTKQKAFSDLHIELIPYYLDNDHYGRLTKVLEKWRTNIKNTRGSDFIDNRNSIDEIL